MGALSAIAAPYLNTAVTQSTGQTLTAAAIFGGIITRTGLTAAVTDTTDTASNIIALLSNAPILNSQWILWYVNSSAFAVTIAAGAGVTLAGPSSVVGGNMVGCFGVMYTGAGAVTMTLLDLSDLPIAGGSTTGILGAEGNINRQISSAGISPGATGADNVLLVYSLPANAFDQSGRGIQITAAGKFGATANNKDVKIIFNPATAVVGSTVGAGGTTIADTGVVATNGTGWEVSAQVFKYGANGSNTQIGIHSQAQIGAAVASLLVPSLITAVENAAILIAVTGNATTATTDIVANWFEANWMN